MLETVRATSTPLTQDPSKRKHPDTLGKISLTLQIPSRA